MRTRTRSARTRPEAIVNVHEAKTHLSRLLKRVDRGEEIVIGRDGQPVARLVPYLSRPETRVLGQATGQIKVLATFDPLPRAVARGFRDGSVFPRE